jgi:hypothetical protein
VLGLCEIIDAVSRVEGADLAETQFALFSKIESEPPGLLDSIGTV